MAAEFNNYELALKLLYEALDYIAASHHAGPLSVLAHVVKYAAMYIELGHDELAKKRLEQLKTIIEELEKRELSTFASEKLQALKELADAIAQSL